MKSIHFGIVVGAALLSAVSPVRALAQPAAGSSVTGSANLALGDGVERSVSVTAATAPDGSVSGAITFRDRSPLGGQDVDGTGDPALAASSTGLTVTAAVNCLVVAGDVAIVGGQVVKSDPARYVGKQLLLLVADSGKPHGPLSWGFYEPEQDVHCASSPLSADAAVEIAGGHFEVKE